MLNPRTNWNQRLLNIYEVRDLDESRLCEINAKGYHPPEPIDPASCTGCKTCELLCPDFAIFVTTEVKKKNVL